MLGSLVSGSWASLVESLAGEDPCQLLPGSLVVWLTLREDAGKWLGWQAQSHGRDATAQVCFLLSGAHESRPRCQHAGSLRPLSLVGDGFSLCPHVSCLCVPVLIHSSKDTALWLEAHVNQVYRGLIPKCHHSWRGRGCEFPQMGSGDTIQHHSGAAIIWSVCCSPKCH